jgi:hypothetical protein
MTDEKCSICRSLMDGTSQDFKLGCSHRFHTECIIDSLRHNRECPICRDTGGIEVNHWSEWDTYEPEHNDTIAHINSCASCGKNNEASELYSTYRLINELGDEILKNRYMNIKQVNKEYRKTVMELDREINTSLFECRDRFKKDKINTYHRIGRSEKFSTYMKNSKKAKTMNGNFKRELSTYLINLGYENDDDLLSKLINEYCQTIKISKLTDKWKFDNYIKSCNKYSLDKYSPAAINSINISLEI